MKPFLLLLAAFLSLGISAQNKAVEMALLQQQMDEGKINLTEFQRQVDRLRIAAGKQRGYPEMPTDVDGRFNLVTKLSTGDSKKENWQLVRRWLVLAGLTYHQDQAFFDEEAGQMLLRVTSRYTYAQDRKRLIFTGDRWSSAPYKIQWLMEVAVTDGNIEVVWREPLLEEYVVNSEVVFEGGGVYLRTLVTLFDGLLPLVNYDHNLWEERLRMANLMEETVTTAERDLREYAGGEVD
ncbi:MAG: hypothetical protein WA952_01605 [Lewinella sp.]